MEVNDIAVGDDSMMALTYTQLYVCTRALTSCSSNYSNSAASPPTHHLTVVKWLNELQDSCLVVQLKDYSYQTLHLLFVTRKWSWIWPIIPSWLFFSFLHSFTIPTSYRILLDGLIASEMVTEVLLCSWSVSNVLIVHYGKIDLFVFWFLFHISTKIL